MKRDFKNKLVLFSFMLYLTLNVESTHEVNGSSEENITVKFTFQDSVIPSKPSLYKNGVKIATSIESNDCKERFALSDVKNQTVTLNITNLTLEDEGTYYVVVLTDGIKYFFESNKISIKVKLVNKSADAENPPVHTNTTQQQGQCGTSGAVFVSCVEYGELDFQNRPERDDRVEPAETTSKDQDGVEYAAIIFPQQKQPPSGRMRNKQQVPAIK
ncbi:uncharacterized protein LOC132131279 isoform X2 [Carassius carassius]|uniref:uncharacterized protein LOC132131279 isoform X2 n=1 Tax=Carassius carassius TaxID=217509 RepID=UPI0028684FBA|nr:uncharacterized protein LOC132131279 isoform X2 [Carassius carassius]